MAVLKEFLQVWDLMSEVVLQPEVDDLHVWQMAIVCFRNFSAQSAYEKGGGVGGGVLQWSYTMQTMGEDLEELGTKKVQVFHVADRT